MQPEIPSALPGRPATAAFRLSKSKYLAGLQCSKRLYLEMHHPNLASPVDERQQALLDAGSEIGVLARRRFPSGVLVAADYRHAQEALRKTGELMADESVPALFEAAVEFDRVLVRVDVLERTGRATDGGGAWRLVEVKSSTKVKPVHLDDLAIQAYVLLGAGIRLAEIVLLRIDTSYRYDGRTLELDRLFTLEDVTDEVRGRLPDVPERVEAMRRTLLLPGPPVIEPDGHCHSPYECPFWAHCTRGKPSRWIFHLPGGERTFRSLVDRGIERIDDIPTDFKLTLIQQRVKEGEEWISPRLNALLHAVEYPVHHLDFETCMPAVPRYPMTRPYQAIPMQWSNHIESEVGGVRHDEFLCVDPVDPRPEFIRTLLASVGDAGSICVYSAYERTILESLAQAFPRFAPELEKVIHRLWDLLTVIRNGYYHPDFEGSYSIKSVLPALVPELSYEDLTIRDGGTAAQTYLRMVFAETDWVERVRLRDALLRYCQQDTLAMLHVRRVLQQKAEDPTTSEAL